MEPFALYPSPTKPGGDGDFGDTQDADGRSDRCERRFQMRENRMVVGLAKKVLDIERGTVMTISDERVKSGIEVANLLSDMIKSPVIYVPALSQVPSSVLPDVYVFKNGVKVMGTRVFNRTFLTIHLVQVAIVHCTVST
jgi:hypothetical protein